MIIELFSREIDGKRRDAFFYGKLLQQLENGI